MKPTKEQLYKLRIHELEATVKVVEDEVHRYKERVLTQRDTVSSLEKSLLISEATVRRLTKTNENYTHILRNLGAAVGTLGTVIEHCHPE